MEKWVIIKKVRITNSSNSHHNSYDSLLGKCVKVEKIDNSKGWQYRSIEKIFKGESIISFMESDIVDAPFAETELWKALEGIE